MKNSNHGRYMVKAIVHASRVLEAFRSSGDVLRLRDVVTRTGLNKGMCFRLLYTLHQCGFLSKVGENHYRLTSEGPAVFTNHQIITPENVDHYYPNDSLLSRA